MDVNDLPEWIQSELDNRGWIQADLVRASKGRLTTAQVSRVLSRQQQAGIKFCQGVAYALDVTLESVLRHVGIIDNHSPKGSDAKEINRILDKASPKVVEEVLEYARYRYGLEKKRGDNHARKTS